MRKYARLVVAAFLTAHGGMSIGLSAQELSIGAVGGAGLTDAARNQAASNSRTWSPSKDWIAGPMFELRFRSRFSVEAEALYRELHATIASVEPTGSLSGVSPFRVETFEFPVLAKYRFGGRKLRVFAEAGPSFRATGNLNFSPSHHGASVGFGVETHWGRLNIAPVVRYTRWAPDLPLFRPVSQLNQVELLAAVSRVSESHSRPLGQRISLGVVVDWELTNDVSPFSENVVLTNPGSGNVNAIEYVTGVKGVIAGPVLEVHLVHRLSVELDGIYRRMRERQKTVRNDGTVYSSFIYKRASTWQFPVLAKHRFRSGTGNPFVEAGPCFRLPVAGLSSHGVAAGGGAEIRWHVLRIAPTFRFTRWAASVTRGSGPFARNEAALLLGLSFGGPPLAKK